MRQTAAVIVAVITLMFISFAVVYDPPRDLCNPPCESFTVPTYFVTNTPATPYPTRTPVPVADVDLKTTSAEFDSQLGIENYQGVSNMELQSAAEALIKLVTDATFLPFAAGMVVAITALIKKLLPATSTVSAGGIAFACQVVVWVLWVLAKRAGIDEGTFTSAVDALTTIASAVLGLVGSSIAATKMYEAARDRNVPVIGTPQKSAPEPMAAAKIAAYRDAA